MITEWSENHYRKQMWRNFSCFFHAQQFNKKYYLNVTGWCVWVGINIERKYNNKFMGRQQMWIKWSRKFMDRFRGWMREKLNNFLKISLRKANHEDFPHQVQSVALIRSVVQQITQFFDHSTRVAIFVILIDRISVEWAMLTPWKLIANTCRRFSLCGSVCDEFYAWDEIYLRVEIKFVQ